MGIFADSVTKTLTVEGGQITIRALSFVELEEASGVAMASAMAKLENAPDAFFNMEGDPDKASDTQYDTFTVLKLGVLAWTFADRVDPDKLKTLKGGVADFVKDEIMALTIRDEAEIKNFEAA